MRFDEINLTNAKFFIFFQVCPFIVANCNKKKKYEISDGILKVNYLVKILAIRLIKSDKNYSINNNSYY